jgi:hypothetical protein
MTCHVFGGGYLVALVAGFALNVAGLADSTRADESESG